MKINSYLLTSTWLILFAILFMLLLRDFTWIFAIFMVVIQKIISLSQQLEFLAEELLIDRNVNGKRFRENDQVKVSLHVQNKGKSTFYGEIADKIPDIARIWEGTNVFLLKLEPGESRYFNYIISLDTRGAYQIGPIHIRYHSQGEMHDLYWDIERYKDVLIIPLPDPVSRYNLPPELLARLGGTFRSKLVGDGMEFVGVREYHRGDSYNKINWKVTAKHGQLHSNEFEINRATNMMIVLDLTEESTAIADASVRSALGLATFLMNYRCKVGIITLGEFIHVIPLGAGKRHLLEITEHLTRSKSIGLPKNRELFHQRLNATISSSNIGTADILLFSSLNDVDNARLLTRHLAKLGNVTVLSPSVSFDLGQRGQKVKFAQNLLGMRKQMIRQYLGAMEIRVFDWSPTQPFDNSVSQWRLEP